MVKLEPFPFIPVFCIICGFAVPTSTMVSIYDYLNIAF